MISRFLLIEFSVPGFLGQLSGKDGVHVIEVTRTVIYEMLAEQ